MYSVLTVQRRYIECKKIVKLLKYLFSYHVLSLIELEIFSWQIDWIY